MRFSYNWLKTFVPGLPAPAKLAELLTFHAFEVERMEKARGDTIFDIDILPNRLPDAGGYIGLAREIAALTRKKLKFGKPLVREGKVRISEVLGVSIEAPRFCRRYTARVIDGVKIKRSPKWLADRLRVSGIKSVNNVVDAANYAMLETGQPLHVFDYDKIAGGNIVVRRAKRGEEFHSLDKEKHTLEPGMLVIADEKGPIALAGIKGGLRAGVTKKTKRVALESANFDSVSVRKTVKRLGLLTDASARFSAGLSPELAIAGLWRLAHLILKVAGGEAYKNAIDVYPRPRRASPITVRISEVRALLGIAAQETQVRRILKRLGFRVKKEKKKEMLLVAEAPALRMDIANEADAIEEIGRVIGYEKITADSPVGALAHPERNIAHFFTEKLRDMFREAGFMETINYVFQSARQSALMEQDTGALLELENPINADERYLRSSLLGGLIKNIALNKAERNSLNLFEIGNIYRRRAQEYEETTHIMAVFTGEWDEKGSGEELFFEGKGFVGALFERLGIADYWFVGIKSGDALSWPLARAVWHHPFRRAAIRVGRETAGVLFEVHPELLRKLGIRHRRVIAFEFLTPALLGVLEREKEFRPISKYPSVIRDIAVLVPRRTRVFEILNVVERIGGTLLVDSDLFDFYEGERIPDGKKSFAFHLIFQSPKRTLTDKEVDGIIKKIRRALEAKREWEVR